MADERQSPDRSPAEIVAEVYETPPPNPFDAWSYLERIPGETHAAHVALIEYATRPIGQRRHIDVAAAIGSTKLTVDSWSSNHRWRERVERFDRARMRHYVEQAWLNSAQAVEELSAADLAMARHLRENLHQLAEIPFTYGEYARLSHVIRGNFRDQAAVVPDEQADDEPDGQAGAVAAGALLAAALDDDGLDRLLSAREDSAL